MEQLSLIHIFLSQNVGHQGKGEGYCALRRDAEALLPERFTTPEGTVPLTFALMTNVPVSYTHLFCSFLQKVCSKFAKSAILEG